MWLFVSCSSCSTKGCSTKGWNWPFLRLLLYLPLVFSKKKVSSIFFSCNGFVGRSDHWWSDQISDRILEQNLQIWRFHILTMCWIDNVYYTCEYECASEVIHQWFVQLKFDSRLLSCEPTSVLNTRFPNLGIDKGWGGVEGWGVSGIVIEIFVVHYEVLIKENIIFFHFKKVFLWTR